jgi:hypothetical protein
MWCQSRKVGKVNAGISSALVHDATKDGLVSVVVARIGEMSAQEEEPRELVPTKAPRCQRCGSECPKPWWTKRWGVRRFCSHDCSTANWFEVRRERRLEIRRESQRRFLEKHPGYYDTNDRRASSRASSARYRERNRERINASRRGNRYEEKLRQKYGLTLEQYEEMIRNQGNCCAICGYPLLERTTTAKLNFVVDHDHDTGKPRGILHMKCNSALGIFKDDPAVLLKAVDYLRRHGK